jgi:hypothetical protein
VKRKLLYAGAVVLLAIAAPPLLHPRSWADWIVVGGGVLIVLVSRQLTR